MIKITTSKPYGMFSNGNLETLTSTSSYTGLDNIDRDYSTAIYIHGDLEDKLGFDIPRFLEGDFNDLLKEKQNVQILYDVVGEKGKITTIKETAIMILWLNTENTGIKKILGYIITPKDKKSIEYALKQQIKKDFYI